MAKRRSATPEEAWAAIEELAQAQKRIAKENAEGMKELRKAQELTEKERRKGEKERREGEKALREAQERTEKERREGEKERREGEKALREAQERTEKARSEGEKALREAQEKTEKALQELTKNLNAANGNFNNKWGKFLESLVKGDLVKLLSKRNIKVDMVRSRLVASDSTGKEVGEFDVVAMNGKEIVTVEVKTTLTKEKVEKFINKLKMFKKYFSEHRDKVLYGGVAFLCEPEDKEARGAAKYAEENGLFVILSPGGEANMSTLSNSKDFKPKPF